MRSSEIKKGDGTGHAGMRCGEVVECSVDTRGALAESGHLGAGAGAGAGDRLSMRNRVPNVFENVI